MYLVNAEGEKPCSAISFNRDITAEDFGTSIGI